MAGFSDIEQRLCLGAGAVERPRPDPQGADVRPHRRPGQPRRGRQGVLVVPRRRPEPRLEPLALPLPAGGVPVRRPDRRERPARQVRPRVRAARHRRVRRRPLLDRRGRLRQGRRRRPDHGRAGRPTPGPTPTTLHVLPTAWFRNTWCWDLDAPKPTLERRGADGAVAIDHPFLGELELLAGPAPDGAGPDGAVLRQRDQRRAACSAPPRAPPYPKDGINDHVVDGATPRSTPTRRAPRCRSGTSSTVAAGATAEVRLRLRPAGAKPGRLSSALGKRRRPRRRPAPRRPTSSTPS